MLIAQSRRRIWLSAGRRLGAAGESLLGWQTLARLVHGGPTSQRALAEAMGQHPAGVCRLLDDLEQNGWVHRARDTQDRRCVLTEVTAKGRSRYRSFLPHLIEAVRDELEPLSGTEQQELRTLLRKIASVEPTALASETTRGKKRRIAKSA